MLIDDDKASPWRRGSRNPNSEMRQPYRGAERSIVPDPGAWFTQLRTSLLHALGFAHLAATILVN